MTQPTDPHLSDLLELKQIAQGTEAEAYTWPRLMKRLDELIQARQAVLVGLAERDAAWAAAVVDAALKRQAEYLPSLPLKEKRP